MAKSSNKSTAKGKKTSTKKTTKSTAKKTTPVDQEVQQQTQEPMAPEETQTVTTVPGVDEVPASKEPEGPVEGDNTEAGQSPIKDEKSSETASQDVTEVATAPTKAADTPTAKAKTSAHIETKGGPSDVSSKRLSADETIVNSFARQIDDYIEHMGSAKPLTSQQGGQWQRRLYTTLQNALNVKGSLFNRVWSNILEKVANNRTTTFNERYIYRFMDETKMSNEDVRNFSNIIHLMISTADPKGRQQALKMIDLSSITKGLYIEGVTDRLQEFYSI